ncbi:MAG: ABC transporter permease [Planctomycetota bacterium]|nr:ABC transporter permease [Planctomycetota bacterium]
MRLWRIVLKSLRQHSLSTGFAVVNIALGVALLVAVVSLREQAHANLTQAGVGVDAILGPKGSPLQIVLNGLYHMDEMPGKIKWPYYQKVLANPIVQEGIPFCTGHSYAGFRVNAIDRRFLTDFEYLPGKTFSFRPEDGGRGRAFADGEEAVAGWAVAKELRLSLGQTFNPVCGVSAGPMHKNTIAFVGVLAPTGTPHDRAIYIPLNTFYTLDGHESVARMAVDEQYREISGAYLKIKRVRGGAMNLNLQSMKYDINQSTEAQLVVPGEVLPRLFEIIGWVDGAFLAVAVLVTGLGTTCLLVSLVSALRERRRDIALMRSIGATRRTVLGLVLSESLVISLFGGLLGLMLGHGIVWIGSRYIQAETGLRFSWLHLSLADAALLPALVVVGLLAGLFPAVQAYRLGVLRNLRPVS